MEITKKPFYQQKYFLLFGLILLMALAFLVGRISKDYKIVSTENEKIQYETKNNQSFDNQYSTLPQQTKSSNANNTEIPQKVYKVLSYIRANHAAPEGYVGGRTFQNREKQLPQTDNNGNKIKYQEWDINPKIEGQNRGAERLVTSEKNAYYTDNHYQSFVQIE